MENLIKPSQYAKEYGISRQAVYAKIKKGTIPSKELNGQIYIDLNNNHASIDSQTANKLTEGICAGDHLATTSLYAEYQAVVASKNETIEALKSSINDLKQSNEQTINVLSGEIDLLKQAFNEMKYIYSNQLLSNLNLQEISAESLPAGEVAIVQEDYKQWVTVVRYLSKYSINPKYYASIMDYVEKIYENGDDRTRLINHEIRLDNQKVDLEFAKEALN
jgi:HAMP domain-containing protein